MMEEVKFTVELLLMMFFGVIMLLGIMIWLSKLGRVQ